VSPRQQPKQLPGPQAGFGSHFRVVALHWVFAGHAVHARPPPPQAVSSAPGRQALPLQQPVGQLAGVQVGVPVHFPPSPGPAGWHDCPLAWQSSHWTPLTPQSFGSRPEKHVAPEQQPLGQVRASHAVPPQLRLLPSHVSPRSEQRSQVRPPTPQAVSSAPARHTSRPPWSAQQPLGQVCALQPTTVLPQDFVSALHVSKPCAAQLLHVRPKVPQRTRSVPERHVPFSSQQPPGQVVGPHFAAPSSPPSVSS
jgi:hypothetical protein